MALDDLAHVHIVRLFGGVTYGPRNRVRLDSNCTVLGHHPLRRLVGDGLGEFGGHDAG